MKEKKRKEKKRQDKKRQENIQTFLLPFSLQNIENVMCHHFAKTGSGLSLNTTSLIKSFEPTKGVAFVFAHRHCAPGPGPVRRPKPRAQRLNSK